MNKVIYIYILNNNKYLILQIEKYMYGRKGKNLVNIKFRGSKRFWPYDP